MRALANSEPHLADHIGADRHHQQLSVCSVTIHHMVVFPETRLTGGGGNEEPPVQFSAKFSNAGWNGGQMSGTGQRVLAMVLVP